mmetsp:Transcript_81079/g.224357  ORF Transcript_81079/g.224357 Transcript_81079/m.224357 type:complete len:250 (+) Transcript_81079:1002-1751(+)
MHGLYLTRPLLQLGALILQSAGLFLHELLRRCEIQCLRVLDALLQRRYGVILVAENLLVKFPLCIKFRCTLLCLQFPILRLELCMRSGSRFLRNGGVAGRRLSLSSRLLLVDQATPQLLHLDRLPCTTFGAASCRCELPRWCSVLLANLRGAERPASGRPDRRLLLGSSLRGGVLVYLKAADRGLQTSVLLPLHATSPNRLLVEDGGDVVRPWANRAVPLLLEALRRHPREHAAWSPPPSAAMGSPGLD